MSGAEAGPITPPYQKHEEVIFQIETVNVDKFMETVRTDIDKAIVDSGATIEGCGGSIGDPVNGGADIAYTSFRYNQDDVNGIINVYGVKAKGRIIQSLLSSRRAMENLYWLI